MGWITMPGKALAGILSNFRGKLEEKGAIMPETDRQCPTCGKNMVLKEPGISHNVDGVRKQRFYCKQCKTNILQRV
jgi:transposase-like protein